MRLIAVNFGLYNYKKCSKWWPVAPRYLLIWGSAGWVTMIFEIAARAFSVSSVKASSVVDFQRYTTFIRASHMRVIPSVEKYHAIFLLLKCVYVFFFSRPCVQDRES